MMEATAFRVWHPAFDVYHCENRMLRLLLARDDKCMSLEHLCILDFFLLYPFLLHRTSMPEGVRRDFREVHVPRDKDQFIQIPSSESLYRDIAVFQKTGISNLAAKGLFERKSFLSGVATLNIANVPPRLFNQLREANNEQHSLVNFLVHIFGSIELNGARGLRALTGLVRRQT
jgi:hypothetical protein